MLLNEPTVPTPCMCIIASEFIMLAESFHSQDCDDENLERKYYTRLRRNANLGLNEKQSYRNAVKDSI